jgi:parallel beta-helix repeat protein
VFTKANAKILLFIIGFVFSIFMFSGVVSAATLNATEAELAASGVKNYTETYNDVPGYVVVNNKNSSSPSFLKTATTWTIQLNNGATTPVTISSVNAPTGPSGSATGTLSKSEYLTVATNVKNFIASNGRAPNYASSSLGNIRYESLLYTYSKVLDFYKSNGRLPNTVSVVYVVGVRTNGVVIPPQDYAPPTVTANPVGGVYDSARIVTLTATDNRDLHPSIYYTLNGSTPTTSSTRYTSPININTPGNTILKFMARDASGNQAAVQTMTYILKLVKNIRTGNIYASIQSAIDDSSTLNGDTIQVHAGTFTENILITKKLTLMAVTGENVILQANSSSGTIIAVSPGINGTVIQGFTIKGSTSTTGIFLYQVSNCTITGNTINNNIANNNANGIQLNSVTNSTITNNTINNSGFGIWLIDSNNNIIQNNSVYNNNFNGIDIGGSNNVIRNNTATYNDDDGIIIRGSSNIVQNNTVSNSKGTHLQGNGIEVYSGNNNLIESNMITNNKFIGLYLGYSSNNTVRKNTIANNEYGIYIMNSSNKISYNNIYSNSKIGLINNGGGTSDASRNWWGHSSAPTQGSTDGKDYYNNGGLCPIEPWLVQNANAYIIGNKNTQLLFTTIQEAINDSTTSPGDTIILNNRTYNENITINKKINLTTDYDTYPLIIGTITVNSGGNGSIIKRLTIHGNINLNANNCTIIDNIIIGNGTSGIIASNSINNKIAYNDITSNGFNGIQSNSSSNTIHGNTVSGCESGIYSENSYNNISSNYLTNNLYGIWTYNSSDTINFNRITQNTYGLKNEIGTINATNNWWGTNNPTSPSDIWVVSGSVDHTKWLVLSINASTTNSGGNSSVTADLAHNNQGEDTLSLDSIPDGVPVNFITNNGTIISQAYTLGGRVSTILNLNTTQPNNVTVFASLDNQTVSTTRFITTGVAVLNITSTAIDNSTGQTLNITYNIPLNQSVTWLSIVWIPTTINGITNLAEELQVIINGTIVLNKLIYNNNGLNTDTLTFDLVYPGVSGFNITFTDPDDSSTKTLNFPGNNISRTSTIVYNGTPYEGVHSFAIATTKISTELFNYWLNQSSLYQSPGGLSDAYATFMTSLMVEYAHDVMAESVSSDLNVTWSRTHPVVVSTHQDAKEVYLTLDTDHTMGMTAVGTSDDLWIFNYLSSSSISFIEYIVMNGMTNSSYQYFGVDDAFGSVIVDMLKIYGVNDESLKSFLQDNYLIIKSGNNYNYMVVDLKTGIVRDINTINNFCGSTITFEVQPIINFIAYGDPNIGYPVSWFGDPWERFTETFGWDGKGKIFLTSERYANPYTDQIGALGTLKVTGTKGSTTFNGSPSEEWVWGPALDLTGLFEPIPDNTISLTLTPPDNDTLIGQTYGLSSLWLVQVTPELPNLPINTKNIDDFTNPEDENTWEESLYDLNQGVLDLLGFGVHYNRAINVNDEVVGFYPDGSPIKMSNKAINASGNAWDKFIDALWGRGG